MNQRKAEPDGDGREPFGRAAVSCAQDNHQEHERLIDLVRQARAKRVSARRMRSVAVGGETARQAEPFFAAGDHVEHRGSRDSSQNLRDHIGRKLGRGKAFCNRQSNGNRGIQVTSRNMADRIGHGQDGEPKSKGHAHKSDTQVWKRSVENRRSATTEDQPKGSNEFGCRSS